MLGQVGGRGHQHALVAGQFARHPFPRAAARRVPQPDGAVKAFQREVGQVFGELQLDVHGGKAALEIGQRRTQPATPKTEGGGQAHRACGFEPALTQLGLCQRKTLQQLGRVLAQAVPLSGGAHVARGALEQAQAQGCLQCGQPFGDHGGCQVQRTCRPGEAAVLADGQHQFKIGSVQLLP